ncbi:MAG: hypothetical protein JST54_20060 [Deltaproteobacteria bacterium]|nr:hypothetical protein [Deltaproteobacteria bacterium]
MLALLVAVSLSQLSPSPQPLRVLVVSRDAQADALVPEISARLPMHGMAAVPREAVLMPLRTAGQATSTWREANAQQSQGLQAEQDLDLARARTLLAGAREKLLAVRADLVDPEGYGLLLAELARVEDEQGDATATDETLREWASLPVAPLDARTFPPPFVAHAARARERGTARPQELPLPWIWQSNAVDAVVVLETGVAGEASSLVMLEYARDQSGPAQVASAELLDITQRTNEIDRALGSLAPRAAVATPAPPPTNMVLLGASFIFPSFAGYARAGQGTFGLGLALLGRYERPTGPAYGGRLDLTWGNYNVEQATATARCTLARRMVRLSVEPGAGIKIRQGVIASDGAIDPHKTAVSLFADCGGYVGLQAGDNVWVELGLTLGLDLLATDYDVNVPVALRTSAGFRF